MKLDIVPLTKQKISLKVTTFSQLVVVSSIHKYTNSIESCCKYIGNHLLNPKMG